MAAEDTPSLEEERGDDSVKDDFTFREVDGNEKSVLDAPEQDDSRVDGSLDGDAEIDTNGDDNKFDSSQELPRFEEVNGNKVQSNQMETAAHEQARTDQVQESTIRPHALELPIIPGPEGQDEIDASIFESEGMSTVPVSSRKYDQSPPDRISQLMDRAPDETTGVWKDGDEGDEPGMVQKRIDYEDDDGGYDEDFWNRLVQLSGEDPISSRSTQSSLGNVDNDLVDNNSDFEGLGMLWGSGLDDIDDWTLGGGSGSSVLPSDVAPPLAGYVDGTFPNSISWVPQEGNNAGGESPQIAADEGWEEGLQLADEVEIEPQVMVNYPMTLEEHERHLAELLAAEEEEMVETEAILNAPAFAESLAGYDDYDKKKYKATAASTSTTAALKNETTAKTPATSDKADTTNKDSALPSNATNFVATTPTIATNVTQPMALPVSSNATTTTFADANLVQEPSLGEPTPSSLSFSDPQSAANDGGGTPMSDPNGALEGNLQSQIPESTGDGISLEEYERQLAEQLEAEKEEMEETEAIMNAPAFAISYDGYGDDEPIKAFNETSEADDLSVLEMDVVEQVAVTAGATVTGQETNSTQLIAATSAGNTTIVMDDDDDDDDESGDSPTLDETLSMSSPSPSPSPPLDDSSTIPANDNCIDDSPPVSDPNNPQS